MAFNNKFVALCAVNDAIFKAYINKLFATSQIIHIGLTQGKSRLCRDSRNSEICFWVFFPTTTRSGYYAFLAAIPTSETIFIGSNVFSAEQLQHKTDISLSYQFVAILSKGKEKLFLLLPFFHHFVIFFARTDFCFVTLSLNSQ